MVQAAPFIGELFEVFANAVPRPATVTGEDYNKLRGGSVREVTSTRGTISLKDVIQEDYYD